MTVHYAIRPADPGAHLFHVTLTLEQPDPEGQRFMLPAWIPGSYVIREFARHIGRVTALAGERKLALRKLDKHTWQCAPLPADVRTPLTLAYEVYAFDSSVRGAYLDRARGFFNGAAVFLLPLGHADTPCRLDIFAPEHAQDWRVATSLPAAGTRAIRRDGFGRYSATDYEALIDHPVEMGSFALHRFEVLGVTHEVALTGQVPKLDAARLLRDLARICEAQVRLFEPRRSRPPFDRYLFLIDATSDSFGGLEHRNSSALNCKRDALPALGTSELSSAYRSLLGVASHEYFHAWQVKRIRPAAFIPYALERENYSRLLWLFEGFTSYYDELGLLRAGLISPVQYLDHLGKQITAVQSHSGRLKHSVADSSFDAWIKYYKQDENAPNSVVSYYAKGALVALALDLTIRAGSRNRRSLDDVMRALWRHYQRAGKVYQGIGEEAFVEFAEQASGLKLGRVLREWTDGMRDPDFAALLAPFGVRFERQAALDQPHFALLGCRLLPANGECRVRHVLDGSPAQAAGLSAGDILIALDELRVTPENIDQRLMRYHPGDRVTLLGFRRDELQRFELRLATQPPPKFSLQLAAKCERNAAAMRRRWLGS